MESSEVYRMRRNYPKEFHCLVKMHLSFLLDLTTDDCDCSFIYETQAQMAPSSPPSKLKGCEAAKKFFTTPRKTSTASAAATPFKGVMEGLPLTMEGVCQTYQLIHFLSRSLDHLRVEGLFRKHGNLKKQQALRERLNRGIAIDLDEGEFTVHEVASVLKMFLAELPEPLLTDACYRAHCQVALMTDRAKQVQALQLLFLLIPDSHYQLLKDTLLLLHATVQEESYNKMSASNLATVFATHLLCPRKLSAEVLQSNHQMYIKSVTLMIEEARFLFESIPSQLADDVAAHFRRLAEEDTSKLLDRPPQFSSVHRVQTRRQARLHKNQGKEVSDSPTRMQSPVVNTIFSFVDRKATLALNEKSTTATELAKLYAHVQSMPESAQKKKLVQKLNDANGIGTPSRRLKTKTQKTKNQLKSLLTPRLSKGSKMLSREASNMDNEKKGWHANSYNIAQVVTSEQRPPSSAMMSFKRRSSEERQMTSSTNVATNVFETPSAQKIDYLSVDFCPKKIIFDADDEDEDAVHEEEDEPELESVSSEASTSRFDNTSSTIKYSDDAEFGKPHFPSTFKTTNPLPDTPEMDKPEIVAKNKKLPPPPIPPRVSSLPTATPVASSPLSQKIAASKDFDSETFATPRNRKPLVLISNSQLPETKTVPVRWDSGYLSQKFEDPANPSSPVHEKTSMAIPVTSEVVDVDEEIERMEKEELEQSVQSVRDLDEDEAGPTPPKLFRLSSGNDSLGSLNESVSSAEFREEEERLLRGDLDPSDSLLAIFDGEQVPKNEMVDPVTPDLLLDVTKAVTPTTKLGRKRRSITELGGPNPMAKTSTPTGIYFETDL